MISVHGLLELESYVECQRKPLQVGVSAELQQFCLSRAFCVGQLSELQALVPVLTTDQNLERERERERERESVCVHVHVCVCERECVWETRVFEEHQAL